MKKYIGLRILRSLLSLIVVIGIVFILIYKYIPKENIFVVDSNISKYNGDAKINYRYTAWEKYGYLDYVTTAEYCMATYSEGSSERSTCIANGQSYMDDFVKTYQDKGYTIAYYDKSQLPFAYKNVNTFRMLLNWFANILSFDNTNKVQNENMVDEDRGIYLGTDWNGVPAVMCYGCEHKYLLYFDGKFPFIHSNWLTINLGSSYPTYANIPIVDVIGDRQGALVNKDVTFPSGVTETSAIMEHTCSYKATLNAIEKRRFTDNYADCDSYQADASMIGTSFFIGIIASLLSYLLGVPLGMLMARYKDKLFDKLGMAYIIFITSVPSLAYIFMFSRIGGAWLGLPTKFSFYGAHVASSYILPIISLALPSAAGLMMWIRRYMLDQSNSDYVKFARAKGMSEREIMTTHIMRNAIIPIAHNIPLDICFALVGAIITERVYAVPGMGKMLTDSINNYNNSMIVALTFIYTGLSIIGLIAGDLLMAVIDPRISFESKGGRR